MIDILENILDFFRHVAEIADNIFLNFSTFLSFISKSKSYLSMLNNIFPAWVMFFLGVIVTLSICKKLFKWGD